MEYYAIKEGKRHCTEHALACMNICIAATKEQRKLSVILRIEKKLDVAKLQELSQL